MPRRAAASSNRWIKITAWTTGIVLVLLMAVLIFGQIFVNRYLRSAEFRQTLEEKLGRNIRADVDVAPIRFEGAQFYVDTFEARGTQEAAFSLAKVGDVRGEISVPSLFGYLFGSQRFRIPNVEMQQLTLEFFDRDRIDLLLPEKEPREDRSGIESINIRNVRLAWGGGGLTGTSVHATPVEGGWKIEGNGGRLTQLGIPGLDLVNARIVRKPGTIFIQEARLRQDSGELSVTGEILSNDKADLLVNASKVNVGNFLTENWKAKLHGFLHGELRIQIPLSDAPKGELTVAGKLRLERGVVEALPILNKIADYLRTDQFRRVELNQASADIHYSAKGLRVENLVLESKQLISIRGGFTVVNNNVDGTFEVGVTPGPLQWIPGSQTKVFTTQRDGYVWAPMRVTGPVDALKEDLSSRLIAGAKGAVVEKVESTATQAVDSAVESGKKAATGVLDLLFGN